MATTTYTVFDGEIVEENRAGTIRDYVPDPLGSTRALLDGSQSQTDTWDYWPYGEEESSTGDSSTPFTYVGTKGYHFDSANRLYVRARYYASNFAIWLTIDPVSTVHESYQYRTNPVTYSDPSGLFPGDICRALCGALCISDPALCLACFEFCNTLETFEEIADNMKKKEKFRKRCTDPTSDTHCFLCPYAGEPGLWACWECCTRVYPDVMGFKVDRCTCHCFKFHGEPKRDCSMWEPYPEPPKPKDRSELTF